MILRPRPPLCLRCFDSSFRELGAHPVDMVSATFHHKFERDDRKALFFQGLKISRFGHVFSSGTVRRGQSAPDDDYVVIARRIDSSEEGYVGRPRRMSIPRSEEQSPSTNSIRWLMPSASAPGFKSISDAGVIDERQPPFRPRRARSKRSVTTVAHQAGHGGQGRPASASTRLKAKVPIGLLRGWWVFGLP